MRLGTRLFRSLKAHRIVLEITESRGWPTPSIAKRRVRQLGAMGFRIALDDLGAGQNGLARTCTIRPIIVKLDRRPLHESHKPPLRLRLVRVLVNLCRSATAPPPPSSA